MCLSRPAQLIESAAERGIARLAPLPGELERSIEIDLRLTPDVAPGDWVLVHAGTALESIPADDAAALIELLELLAGDQAPPVEPLPIGGAE
ncbi:MAG TPA: HypC/HybG/HupF family hydrogenase formation chaperone [Chloroflexota bacterium]|nr:HypC/HybG/HupF family hydrogenase formation chaperone [Chloroflexota bacterium]